MLPPLTRVFLHPQKWCLALVAVSLWAVAAPQTGEQCSAEIAVQCPEEDDPAGECTLCRKKFNFLPEEMRGVTRIPKHKH